MDQHFLDSKRKIGDKGEDIAVRYLLSHGYTILSRNYQIKGGEIDIVARDGYQIVFIEVRYRNSELHAHPLDTFGRMKRRNLLRTVYFYAYRFSIDPETIRIDFIGIMPKKDGTSGYHLWHRKGVEV